MNDLETYIEIYTSGKKNKWNKTNDLKKLAYNIIPFNFKNGKNFLIMACIFGTDM